MIIDTLFLLASSFLAIVFSVLSGLSFFLPAEFYSALSWAFGYIFYVDLILPLTTLMEAVGVLLTFLTFWFMFKKILIPLISIIRPGANLHTDSHERDWIKYRP